MHIFVLSPHTAIHPLLPPPPPSQVGRIYGTEASGVPLRWEIKTTGATGGGHEILGRGSSAADANQQFVVDYDEVNE